MAVGVDFSDGEGVRHGAETADMVGMGMGQHQHVDLGHIHPAQLVHHLLPAQGVAAVHQQDLPLRRGIDGAVTGGDRDLLAGGGVHLRQGQVPGGEPSGILRGIKDGV